METQEIKQDMAEMMEPKWDKLNKYLEEKTVLTVTVDGIVNGGVISNVEGVRGFIPASMIALSYVEDLNVFLGKELKVNVITVEPEKNRLVMSAKDVLRAEVREAKKNKIAAVEVGTVFDGKVDKLTDFGAFVNIGDGMSGLVHISQISLDRVKDPADVLKIGDEVKVKVIAVKDGKLSLSIKALLDKPEEEKEEVFQLPKAEAASTTLGDLFKNIKLD